MATPPQSFTLKRSIFNETLYSRLREFWLAGVPHNATSPPFEALQKWFGVGRSPEEKAVFDGQCYSEFGEALEFIGPSKLALPAWEGYEKDLENAEVISAPLLAEVRDALAENVEGGVQTLLSLSLLLDQMPRNIYRDGDGLRSVYRHYDRLAWSLLRSCMKLSPNPLEHVDVKGRPLYLTWYLMPLMHSEHLPSHEIFLEYARQCRLKFLEKQDSAAVEYMDHNIEFEEKHIEPLKLFGRYPHRNEALGRKCTPEEEAYLQTAETFGVKQNLKDGKEDEKQAVDRSEL